MKIKLFKNRSKKSRRLAVPLVLATVLLLVFGSMVAVGTTLLNEPKYTTTTVLGDPIVVTEDLTLTEDLLFSSGHGLIIGANGITIDGAGYKITGSKDKSSCEWITATDPAEATAAHGILNSGYDNVVIKNLEIENFATGIYLHGIGQNNVENNKIENCDIHDNGLDDMSSAGSDSVTHGIHMVFSKNTEIINNDIYNNEGTGMGCEAGGNGIFMYGGDKNPDQNIISENDIYHNAKSGFWCKKQADYNVISNNHIYENGNGAGITDPERGGIILRCKSANWNTMENNQIDNNNGDGMFIGGNNNDIRDNDIIANSHHGVNLARNDGSKNNYLYGNVICSNHGYDVYNVHMEADNTGDENTGATAYNYRDEGTTGSTYFSYSCGDNNPPNTPDVTGPSFGNAGTEYDYTFVTTDPNGDTVYYYIDWGDGQVEEWIGPYDSDAGVTVKHTWASQGTYSIRVKAKDIHGAESGWGTQDVTMPKNKELDTSLLLRFLEQHPRMFPILRQLLGDLIF